MKKYCIIIGSAYKGPIFYSDIFQEDIDIPKEYGDYYFVPASGYCMHIAKSVQKIKDIINQHNEKNIVHW